MKRIILVATASLLLAACSGSDPEPNGESEEQAVTNQPDDSSVEVSANQVIDIASFDSDSLVQEPEIVTCTVADDIEAECAEIVVKYLPDNLEIGPFCPTNIFSDVGGIWDWDGDEPGPYRLNEEFFTMLDEQGFTFYDEDGNTYIGDPAGGLVEGGSNCLEATQDDTVEMTATIPLIPVVADTPTDLGTVAQVGIGVDGVPILADAPSVLDRGHLPALDVCGGHVDPGGWYHWHATATDIEANLATAGVEVDCGLEQDPTALFGYAFDGFALYGSQESDGSAPAGIDECGGHIGEVAESDGDVYHYHAGTEFPNLPTCLVGITANGAFLTTANGGIGAGGGGQGGSAGGPPEGERPPR